MAVGPGLEPARLQDCKRDWIRGFDSMADQALDGALVDAGFLKRPLARSYHLGFLFELARSLCVGFLRSAGALFDDGFLETDGALICGGFLGISGALRSDGFLVRSWRA